jgi:hypothetical protein
VAAGGGITGNRGVIFRGGKRGSHAAGGVGSWPGGGVPYPLAPPRPRPLPVGRCVPPPAWTEADGRWGPLSHFAYRVARACSYSGSLTRCKVR